MTSTVCTPSFSDLFPQDSSSFCFLSHLSPLELEAQRGWEPSFRKAGGQGWFLAGPSELGSWLAENRLHLSISWSYSGLLGVCFGISPAKPFPRTTRLYVSKYFSLFLGELQHHCEAEPSPALELGIRASSGMCGTLYKNEEYGGWRQDSQARVLEQLEFMGGSRW